MCLTAPGAFLGIAQSPVKFLRKHAAKHILSLQAPFPEQEQGDKKEIT